MKIEGSSMRYMSMSEMRDWPKQFDGSYNQAGFYAYTRYTRNTTETPTYRYYKMSLNKSAADTDDAIFTLSYTTNIAAENKDTNYITVNNKEITVALIEANIRNSPVPSYCYIADDNTTVLGYTRDTFNIQVSLASKAIWNVLDDSIATLVAADNANATEISTVKQTANQISSRVQTIEGDYVTSSQLSQTSTQIMSEVYQKYDPMLVQKSQMVDFIGKDTTMFYPVAISLWHKNAYQHIRVSRLLDEGTYGAGPSQYGDHTNSNNGFVVDLDWRTIPSGWGQNWDINEYNKNTTNKEHPETDWSSAYKQNTNHTDENKFVARYIVKYYTAWTKTQTVGNDTIPLDHIAGHIEQNFMGSISNTLTQSKCPVTYNILNTKAHDLAVSDHNIDPTVNINTRQAQYLATFIEQYNDGWQDEIVYLRGGSKYLIETDWSDAIIEPFNSYYFWEAANDPNKYNCKRPAISYTNFWINPTDEQTRSEILQKADEIQLNVYNTLNKRTGIDVINGQITLNASNTLITGDTLVMEQNQGITIKDDDDFNNINISGKDIAAAGFGANNVYYVIQTGVKSKVCTFPNGQTTTNTFTWDENLINQLFNLGKLNSGSTIRLELPSGQTWANPSWGVHSTNEHSAIGPTISNDPLLTIKLWKDSSVVKTFTIKKNNVTTTGSLNYDVSTNGSSYKLTFELDPVTINNSSYLNTSLYASFNIGLKITATNNNSVNIGTNGANFVARPYNMQINSTNGIILENINSGKSGIKIDDTNAVPLQKASNGGWVTNGNILRVKNLHNSTGDVLSNDYDLYLYTQNSVVGGEHKFNLSTSNVPIGRTVYFKSTAQNIKLINSQIILRDNPNIQTECNIETHFAMAVWTGSYWLVRY